MKPLSPFFFVLKNIFPLVGGFSVVGYPETIQQSKVSSLRSSNKLAYVYYFLHACLFEKYMSIEEPGGGWFLCISGFCILENEKLCLVVSKYVYVLNMILIMK